MSSDFLTFIHITWRYPIFIPQTSLTDYFHNLSHGKRLSNIEGAKSIKNNILVPNGFDFSLALLVLILKYLLNLFYQSCELIALGR